MITSCPQASAGHIFIAILLAFCPVACAAQENLAEQSVSLPPGIQVKRDVAYGNDSRQTFDVYYPVATRNAPIIFMVHGGAWHTGDKADALVVTQKAGRWVPKGLIFISANYRLLPDTDPLEQAGDIVRAIAFAQKNAVSWGGDQSKIILMGHSAGAHLVTLIATDSSLSEQIITTSWLGTIALENPVFNLEAIMQGPHMSLFDTVFGSQNDEYWKAASPYHALSPLTKPLLAVCSSQLIESKQQCFQFAQKAQALGVRLTVLEKDLSHGAVNSLVGVDPLYTSEIESFMASLDPVFADRLR